MNLTFINLRNALLEGTVTAAQLDTLISTDAAHRSAVQMFGGHVGTSRMLAESSTAMAIIQQSSQAMYQLLSREVSYLNLTQSPYFLQPGATGTKLRRQVFTSSGTWTRPSGLAFLSVALIGGGGGGGHYSGGGGGEVFVKHYPGSAVGTLAAAHQVDVGTAGGGKAAGSTGSGGAGGSSNFYELPGPVSISAAGGGAGGANAASGGATASTVQFGTWCVPTFSTSFWQPECRVWGGASAANCQLSIYRSATDNVRILRLGTASTSAGTAGSGIGAGGTWGLTISGFTGSSAAANTGCGGGGAGWTGSAAGGGNGGTGLVVLHWLLQ